MDEAVVRSLLLAAALATAASSAPVPARYRAADQSHPAELAGDWQIHWQGGVGEVTFREPGGWTCLWCGQRWIGYWEVRDGILVVTEAIEPARPGLMPNWYTWKAVLDPGKRAGRLPSGGAFTLTPRK